MRLSLRVPLVIAGAAALSACADGGFYDPLFGGPAAGPYRGYETGPVSPPPAYPYGGASGAPARGETVTVLGCPERRGTGYFTIRSSDGRGWTLDNPQAWPESASPYAVEATGRVLGAGAEGTNAALGDVRWRYTGVRCSGAAW